MKKPIKCRKRFVPYIANVVSMALIIVGAAK